MILDGVAPASLLPPSHTALMDGYADGLRDAAIDMQRRHGLALSALLGVIIVGGGDMVGVGSTAELVGELRDSLDADNRARLDSFLARPVPATHLRLVVWNADGVSLGRLDTVLPAQGGVA
jgi:hypothetical protein